MALATLGLVILRSASISWVVRDTGWSSSSIGEGSDGALALVADQLAQVGDGGFHALEVRVHLERALEVLEGALGLVEGQVDLAVARQRAPVIRVALDDLVAIA